jgi:cell division protein FtsL
MKRPARIIAKNLFIIVAIVIVGSVIYQQQQEINKLRYENDDKISALQERIDDLELRVNAAHPIQEQDANQNLDDML